MPTHLSLRTIECDLTEAPLRTAVETLQGFLRSQSGGAGLAVQPLTPHDQSPAAGTVLVGTAKSHPLLAQWVSSGKLPALAPSATVDTYEIVVVDNCLAVLGANARAALYGVFRLTDILQQLGGVPDDFHERAKPALDWRILHPRARGGFGGYQEADFEFIARCGGNIALVQHDWMAEKTLFSFVECYEFPNATPAKELERNRERLRQSLRWGDRYGLGGALWLCESVCQGGPWIAEERRQAFLKRFPAEVLSDSGTYQGQVLCLAHPLVQQAYRSMVHQLLNDFPELEMFLVFTLDSSGELCDPAKCERHRGVSKLTQYNQLLALLLDEARRVRPRFQIFSVAWSWKFRGDPSYLAQQASLPPGAGLATLPDAEAWSFDRKQTDALREQRALTHQHRQALLGYDIFLWGDDTIFPSTELYDFPLGIAAKLHRWHTLGADGVFDQWGTQAEYLPANAIALRAMFFEPELAEPVRAKEWCEQLAQRQYGEAAGVLVGKAWSEIEAAQQIQSDHTYYWHELRPNWARVALGTPLTLEALSAAKLEGAEPAKPDGKTDYVPFRTNEENARVLGQALLEAAKHFQTATDFLQQALAALPEKQTLPYAHWLTKAGPGRTPLTPRQQLEKQWNAVRLQAGVQREFAHFYAAFALVKTLPEPGNPARDKQLEMLRAIQAEAAITSPAFAQLLEATGTTGKVAEQFRTRVAGLSRS